jgi:hypothetical protein
MGIHPIADALANGSLINSNKDLSISSKNEKKINQSFYTQEATLAIAYYPAYNKKQ